MTTEPRVQTAPLLLDTHVIVWMATGDPRLKRVDIAALSDPARPLLVSAVVAFELEELQNRGRIALAERLDFLREKMAFEVADLPRECWSVAAQLPEIHRDPVDRMLIAHAMVSGAALVTADQNIRRYPIVVL